MASTSRRMLFIPSVRRGNGQGHIRRCLAFAERAGASSRVWPYATNDQESWGADELAERFPHSADWWITDPDPGWDLVVVDRRVTSSGEARLFRSYGPVVFLDEGGPCRDDAVAVLDTLPFPGGPANRSSRGYLDLPARRRDTWPTDIRRVLVSFGGEDARGQGEHVVRSLMAGHPEWDVTLVRGPLDQNPPPATVTVLDAPENLAEILHGYDLVVAGFGLVCFEALHARVPVVVVPQTEYHRQLANLAGLALADDHTIALPTWADVLGASRAAAPAENRDLVAELAELSPEKPGCPVCGTPGPFEFREEVRSFATCGTCSMTYQKRLVPQNLDYGPEYFFEQYQAQYGKTYLDDFEHLRAMAASRLDVIESLAGEGLDILDVGCAYGAFLKEASHRGHQTLGLDVSEDAIHHVTANLGLRGVTGGFPEGLSGHHGPGYGVLTMWYVVEHFPEVARALESVADLLVSGGVFAFSTPNFAGISRRSNRRAFFRSNPEDHYTLWSTKNVRTVLARFGFRVERIRVTGHHPERFPGAGADPGPIRRWFFGVLSRFLGLGDTFEVYARKVGP